MSNENKFIEVKVYSSGIYPGKAREIVKQGVSGVISSGNISDNARVIFDNSGVWYRDNVEPSDLESEGSESEGGE